ncbi:MAG TPA: GDSL-type esterase/lipase family protein [Eudoraea sp.]|nr:GDSL-type esterase/lipase family protein [Eudoraea sp.]
MYKALLFILVLIGSWSQAQDPLRFQEEVAAIQKKYDTLWNSSRETVVFTGSSSIRFWKNLQDVFPQYQIVNSGFGGSHASDLLVYAEDLVLKYRPAKVFIYEGDNDIAFKKKPGEILSDTEQIIHKIRGQDPNTKIIIIAAKPSLARWHLKRSYKRLNRRFKRLCSKDRLLEFADVWDAMLNGRHLREDIFIDDGLHMNPKGYELWYDVIKPYMN